MLVTLYLVLCVLSGYWGRNTFAGPVGFFLIGLFFTPLVSLLVLLLAQSRLVEPKEVEEE
ncbi:hypothetical protein CWB99_01675 [Pseudoalteromonas rubra]|jgi:hypothetical protein|uniref:Uncharacterized protein n=1 Tax=Pseudoalteromonas rubra TaxID=43658 RepID=A0A5S3X696_9GAMM|nr:MULTISPECIES: hypothetical protein [Pseudoalteromonas]AZZ95802.1 hypothetical protein ELR70_00905 [Pseudoalteromonas sp. R3]TMP32608.1 hypothetical protein CWB99_01675 [Pseudoalteromonas rubra]TMP34329.1 hypothetical protein CWC00_08125 [Pseudoalteromonas rubra]TMP39568.1 hypothetical protein CWB98_02980 [Pseudoalteromonas rubra]